MAVSFFFFCGLRCSALRKGCYIRRSSHTSRLLRWYTIQRHKDVLKAKRVALTSLTSLDRCSFTLVGFTAERHTPQSKAKYLSLASSLVSLILSQSKAKHLSLSRILSHLLSSSLILPHLSHPLSSLSWPFSEHSAQEKTTWKPATFLGSCTSTSMNAAKWFTAYHPLAGNNRRAKIPCFVEHLCKPANTCLKIRNYCVDLVLSRCAVRESQLNLVPSVPSFASAQTAGHGHAGSFLQRH